MHTLYRHNASTAPTFQAHKLRARQLGMQPNERIQRRVHRDGRWRGWKHEQILSITIFWLINLSKLPVKVLPLIVKVTSILKEKGKEQIV
jgi:hypothetical protein